ncbi:MAG: GDP-mannose 4,6-dehydratase [Patescibacteria group bacterium]
MRILVTGGAGFVGSHLIDFLLREGHEVICLDSFFSGQKQNISHNFGNPRFSFLKYDIREPLTGFYRQKIDRVYNLACPASPVQYQFDPILTLETSVKGVQNVLELAIRTGARVLHTSTSEVYGDPLEHPQKESYFGNVNTVGMRSCYDEGKRAAETLCKDYHEEHGVDVRLVRIFNTYGPRMMFNDGRVLSNFILQALLGEDLTVHGDGRQTRSFMYIDDLVSGMNKCLETDLPEWGPINLGNPEERTINDLALAVIHSTSSKSRLVHIDLNDIPSRAGDPKQRCPDIARAKKLLGWEPTIDFNTGLDKTIADFRGRLENRPHVALFCKEFSARNSMVQQSVREIAKRLPGYEFDLIASHTDSDKEENPRIHIYRTKNNSVFSRWFFFVSAALKAKKLHRKYNYQIIWAITIGHGAFAAAFFSWFCRGKVPFLLSVYERNITEKMIARGRITSPIYKFIFRHAHRWQVVGDMSEIQRSLLKNDRAVIPVKFDGNWDKLAGNTKELFQELEILATRL